MSKKADLSPPLGWMGGTCKVVDRIEDTVRTPSLRENLSDKVEQGGKLQNPEAAKVYALLPEKGGGLFKQLRITPHAQYRMDLRGVTLGDLRVFFADFSRKLSDWKSQNSVEWRRYTEQVLRKETIEWIDKRLGDLLVVFTVPMQGVAQVVTTFWKGENDPAPESCDSHKHAAETLSVRTLVKDTHPYKSDTGQSQGESGKYPNQALPAPWSRSKPMGPVTLSGPGPSGSNSDGTVHKDMARTQGVPGDRSPHPNNPASNTPVRRPGMTAMEVQSGMKPPAYPTGDKRHKKQRGQAYRYFHNRYKRQRGTILNRQKRRYKRLKNNGQFTLDRDRRKKNPERFKTRPNGGAISLSDRGKRQREKQKKKASGFDPVPFYYFSTNEWGELLSVDDDGMATFTLSGESGETDLDTFFEEVVVDPDYLEGLLEFLDDTFGYDPEEGLDSEEDIEDAAFDAWLDAPLQKMAQLANEVLSSFYRQPSPPNMAPETRYDRAYDQGDRARSERPRLEDISEYTTENSGNPGGKVQPYGQGHFQKGATLLGDIRSGCSSDLVNSSKNIPVKLRRVDAKNAMWLFDVKGSEETPYRVRLQAIRQGNVRSLGKTHVRLSCSCPFWKWQGPEYWAKKGGYLFGDPRGQATKPDVKDPKGSHLACKHVLACLNWVQAKDWSVPSKKASLINRVAERYLEIMEVRDA